MLDFFKKPKPLLGLDISDTDLRVIEINRRDNQYYVEQCASEKITGHRLQDKQTKHDQAHALRKLVEASQIHDRQVAVAVSGPSVFTRIIQLDAILTEADLQEQIELGLEAWVPFQLEEVFYDYEVLGSNAIDPNIREVRLAVAKRDLIETQRQWIESTGLKVAVVDIASLALERADHLFVRNGEITSLLNSEIVLKEAPSWLLALGLASWGF